MTAPDLSKHAPRSPRVRLGGYVILPRILDKGRASAAKTNGEYTYDCPMDQMFFKFAGIDAGKLKKELAKGKSDTQILTWIDAQSKHEHNLGEIYTWSAMMEHRAPGTVEMRNYFNELHTKVAHDRHDIATWFDLLDVDDYVSFGGEA